MSQRHVGQSRWAAARGWLVATSAAAALACWAAGPRVIAEETQPPAAPAGEEALAPGLEQLAGPPADQGPGFQRGRGFQRGQGFRGGRGPGGGRGARGGEGFQPGRGRGRGGPPGDARFAADRDVFHFLLANHDKIKRTVKMRPDGVETVTESADAKVAEAIQDHVHWMHARVTKVQPIRMRDPLFAELFRHAEKIDLRFNKTPQGVKVVETSKDPYVAELIKAHAHVVSQFVARGFQEAHQSHPVPADSSK